MSKLQSLRIKNAPPAFEEYARKHNALVDMIATMTGGNGLKVTVSDNNLVIGMADNLTLSSLTVTGNATVNNNLTVGSDFTLSGTLMTKTTYDVCAGGSVVSKTFVVNA